jgi:hypothetical protein
MSTAEGGGNIVTDGLVLYLDAANPKSIVSGSTTWNDLSRGGNNGTLTGGPTFNSGNGGSLVFDGSDDYVSLLITPNNIVSTNFTICGWFKSNVNTQQIILNNQSFTNRFYISTYNRSGTFIAHWGIGTVQNFPTSNAIINTSQWYQYCVTYDGTNATGYLNGILTDTTNIGLQTYQNNTIRIGRFTDLNNFYFNGNIAQNSIYNRALTATEIFQNYNATKGRFGL